MLYIPKINDYLKSLTNEEVMDFVAINLMNIFISHEYFKSVMEEKNLTKSY